MSIQIFTTTLRLHFGADGSREIKVPVDVRKGSYSGRYELFIDDVHVGWVVRFGGQTARRSYTEWFGYLTKTQSGLHEDYQGHQVTISSTRWDAIHEIVFKLSQGARTNVLADRAELAYAE